MDSIAHYQIVKKLGAGGMGEVYLAKDSRLDRSVAIKVLPNDVTSDQERLRRFLQEAKAASALNHPGICMVHEVGETDDGHPYIVMEYVEGQGLDARIGDQPLSSSDIIDIAMQ